MSASMSYRSTTVVPGGVLSDVKELVSELCQGYEWWAEPINLFDNPVFPEHLYGNTKLFCLLDGDEGVAHDCFMASADADKIASILEAVSEKFGIDWVLMFEDDEAGRIEQGKRTAEFEEQREMFLEVCTMMEVELESLNRQELLKIYQDR